MNLFYILLDKKPVKVSSSKDWTKWIEREENSVVKRSHVGNVFIETVFIGIADGSPPALFETVIYGGPHNMKSWRYQTYEQAVIGHREALQLLTES